MNKRVKLIDMKCDNCKKEFPISKELKRKTIDRIKANGRLWFYEEPDSREPMEIQCPNCKEFPRWYEGQEGAEANEEDSGIHIGGNVVGGKIVIGDNNIV